MLSAGRSTALTAVGVVFTLSALAFQAAMLTRFPVPYSDEGLVGASAWSLASGHGRRQPLLFGTGVYDRVDQWGSIVGKLPFLAAQVLDGASLESFRAGAFAVGVLIIGLVFVASRRYGAAPAAATSALLACSYGFVAVSHWVRTDAVATVIVATVLVLLARDFGTIAIGMSAALVTVGIGAEPTVISLAPGVLAVALWESGDRRRRALAAGAGSLAGACVYVPLRLLPSPTASVQEFRAMFSPGPYHLPLLEFVEHLRLSALTDETRRYELTTTLGSSYLTRLVIEAGVLAAIPIIASAGKRSTPRQVAALLLVSFVVGLGLVQGNKGGVYLWYSLPLAVSCLVGFLAVRPPAGAALLRERAVLLLVGVCGIALGLRALAFAAVYSQLARALLLAAAIALVWLMWRRFRRDLVAGIGATVVFSLALVGWAAGGATWRDVAAAGPFALVAGGGALRGLAVRDVLPSLLLLGAALISAAFLVTDARGAPASPLASSSLQATANRVAAGARSVMGEWQWWYLFRNDQYRANSAIWMREYVWHESFGQAFHDLCPDVIVLDDDWLRRYRPGTQFPNISPTNPAERTQLIAMLRRGYRVSARATAAGDRFVFWRRQVTCRRVGEASAHRT